MKTIVRITECAGRYLKKLLLALARSPRQYLRLVPGPGGLAGLLLDEIQNEDQVIRLDGEPLLVLSPVLVPVMKGATLDCVDAGEGPRLSLTR